MCWSASHDSGATMSKRPTEVNGAAQLPGKLPRLEPGPGLAAGAVAAAGVVKKPGGREGLAECYKRA